MIFKFLSRVANVLLEATVTVLITGAGVYERVMEMKGDCHCQGLVPHQCGAPCCIHR